MVNWLIKKGDYDKENNPLRYLNGTWFISCCLFSAEGVKSGSVWIEGCHFILPNLFTG